MEDVDLIVALPLLVVDEMQKSWLTMGDEGTLYMSFFDALSVDSIVELSSFRPPSLMAG